MFSVKYFQRLMSATLSEVGYWATHRRYGAIKVMTLKIFHWLLIGLSRPTDFYIWIGGTAPSIEKSNARPSPSLYIQSRLWNRPPP